MGSALGFQHVQEQPDVCIVKWSAAAVDDLHYALTPLQPMKEKKEEDKIPYLQPWNIEEKQLRLKKWMYYACIPANLGLKYYWQLL